MIAKTARLAVIAEPFPPAAMLMTQAAAVAGRLGAVELYLLRVIAPPAAGSMTPADVLPLVDLAERHAERELYRWSSALSGLPVTRTVLVGRKPDEEIARWLRAHPVDFVVMAASPAGRRRSPLRSRVLAAVLTGTNAPLITVHASGPVCGATMA